MTRRESSAHATRVGGLVACATALFVSRAAFAQDVPPPPAGPPPVVAEPARPPEAAAPAVVDPGPPPPDGYPPGVYSPGVQGAVPPLPPAEHHGFKMPPWSVRIDPFTWLIEGKLGLELEVGVLKWMSVELVPVFVTNSTPPTFSSFSSRDSGIEQHSNGLGPLSGTTLDAGFWLGGHVLHGYVLRVMYTNYGYTYVSQDHGTELDRFHHTDRWLMGMLGSNATFGPFTIGGGIGLGVELNSHERCVPGNEGCGDLELVTSGGGRGIVSTSFFPVVLAGRISLGVTFD